MNPGFFSNQTASHYDSMSSGMPGSFLETSSSQPNLQEVDEAVSIDDHMQTEPTTAITISGVPSASTSLHPQSKEFYPIKLPFSPPLVLSTPTWSLRRPSPISSSDEGDGTSLSATTHVAKIRYVETPTMQVEALQRQLRQEKAKVSRGSGLRRERSRIQRNLEAALGEYNAATKAQVVNDHAIWARKAAEYEQRLRAQQDMLATQESRLQAISSSYTARDAELRNTLKDRLQQLNSLALDLEEKDSAIGSIESRYKELSAKLEAVQDELLRERERQAAEREREMLALEAKMTANLQILSKTLQLPQLSTSVLNSRAESLALPRATGSHSVSRAATPSHSSTAIRATGSRSVSRAATPSRSHPPTAAPPQQLQQLQLSPELPDIPLSTASPHGRRPDLMSNLPPASHRQRAQEKATKEVVVAEKARLKQTKHRNFHLSQVRRLFSDLFESPEDEDFIAHHIAAQEDVVDSYLDGTGPGPDRADLRFTSKAPYNNAWNRAICTYLGGVLWDRQQTEKWQLANGQVVATVSEAYWEDAVLEKFKRIRSSWIDAQGRVVLDSAGQARLESRAETNKRRFNQEEERHTASRQRERRSKRWDRRKQICIAKIQFATIPFEKNRWTQFLQIIENLGREGMSSDESATEDVTHRPCYRVSVLLWRRDLDAIMEMIDAERFSPQSGYSARGSTPTARHRQNRRVALEKGGKGALADDITLTRRPPVTHLPLAFYDEEWLAGCTEEYIKQVLCAQEGYQWVAQVANSHVVQNVLDT